MIGLSELDLTLSGWWLLLALIGLGLAIGILTGLFGVGGGFLTTPLLNVLFGLDYTMAVGSGLCFIVGTSASGLRRHMRLGNVEAKTIFILAGGAVCGTLLGARLHNYLKALLALGAGEHGFRTLMDTCYLVLLIAIIAILLTDRRAALGRRSLLQALPLAPHVALPGAGLEGVSLPGLSLTGLLLGLMTGMLGIGGGVLLIPLLITVVGLSAHQAVGTSLGLVQVSAIVGTIKYGLSGDVSLLIAMELLVGSAVGVQIGVWIAHRLHGERLKRWFAVVVAVTVLILAGRMLLSL